MEAIVDWVKNYSMAVLLMTVMTSIAAKKEYKKYIQFFVEIILVMTLVNPLFQAAGKSEGLFEKISYDSFWQGLEGIRKDQEKIDFLNDDYYMEYYEKAIGEDVRLLAENYGYGVIDVKLTLNEAFGVETMELKVAKLEEEAIIVGRVENGPEEAEITALREKLAVYYQIGASQISITD